MAAAASMTELLPAGAGFHFDPDDDVLVARYLLPRLRGQPLPCDGIVVEADPFIVPPWELLGMYGRKNDAFFFAAGNAKTSKQRDRAGGGCWKKKLDAVGGEKLVVPGTGEVIAWRKYALTFHADGEQSSTGWVMDEYAVTVSADLASSSSIMAYHIRFTGHGKNSKEPEPQDWASGDDALLGPPLEQCMSPSKQGSSCSCVLEMDSADEDEDDELEDEESSNLDEHEPSCLSPFLVAVDYVNPFSMAQDMFTWSEAEHEELVEIISEVGLMIFDYIGL